jgi:hypothetical protein
MAAKAGKAVYSALGFDFDFLKRNTPRMMTAKATLTIWACFPVTAPGGNSKIITAKMAIAAPISTIAQLLQPAPSVAQADDLAPGVGVFTGVDPG